MDDNPSNLAEALHYCSDISVGTCDMVDGLIAFANSAEKKDLEHKRLSQYRVLEKKFDYKKQYSSNEEFLSQSNIKVDIKTDCIFIFMCFLNVRIRGKLPPKIISSIAPLTFGVYLIHAHSNVTDMTWGVLDMPSHMTGALFVLFQFAAVISIFAICAAVDFIRIITIGRIENIPLLINVCDKVQNKVSGLFTALIKD